MPGLQRVLILYANPLFAQSLKSLLQKEDSLEVIMAESSGSQGATTLEKLRPEVLILEESARLSPEEDAYIRDQVPTLIRVSLQESTLRVVHQQRIPSAGAQDLLKAIKSHRPATRSRRQRQKNVSEVKHG